VKNYFYFINRKNGAERKRDRQEGERLSEKVFFFGTERSGRNIRSEGGREIK
jgi:hypothetical protein